LSSLSRLLINKRAERGESEGGRNQGVGSVRILKSQNAINYTVSRIGDLNNVIISHFIKYPLISQKRADFELFKSIVEIMNRKGHLTLEGLQEIVNIRASINLGLSEELKAEFPDVIAVQRPLVQLPEKIDPNWLAGFVSGEGCFMLKFKNLRYINQGLKS